jgi:hypothetical protein
MKPFLTTILFAAQVFGQVGHVWLDRTGSVSPSDLSEALKDLKARLPVMVEQARIQRLEVFAFAGDPFIKPSVSITLPRFSEEDCRLNSEATIMLREVYEKRQKECQLRRNEALERWRAEVRKAINNQFPSSISPASDRECTSIFELLIRLSRTAPKPQLAIIVSDGLDDCTREPMKPLPAPVGTRVVMVVLNGKGGGRYLAHLDSVEKRWRKVAEWLRVASKAELADLAP